MKYNMKTLFVNMYIFLPPSLSSSFLPSPLWSCISLCHSFLLSLLHLITFPILLISITSSFLPSSSFLPLIGPFPSICIHPFLPLLYFPHHSSISFLPSFVPFAFSPSLLPLSLLRFFIPLPSLVFLLSPFLPPSLPGLTDGVLR